MRLYPIPSVLLISSLTAFAQTGSGSVTDDAGKATSVGGWGTAGLLCGNRGNPAETPELFNPPPNGLLFPVVRG